MSDPFTVVAGSVRPPLHRVVILAHVFNLLIMAVLIFQRVLDVSICNEGWRPAAQQLWSDTVQILSFMFTAKGKLEMVKRAT